MIYDDDDDDNDIDGDDYSDIDGDGDIDGDSDDDDDEDAQIGLQLSHAVQMRLKTVRLLWQCRFWMLEEKDSTECTFVNFMKEDEQATQIAKIAQQKRWTRSTVEEVAVAQQLRWTSCTVVQKQSLLVTLVRHPRFDLYAT